MAIPGKRILLGMIVAALTLPAIAGLFGPKGDSNEEKRAAVRKERDAILAKLYEAYPDAKDKVEKAAGYGAFNNKSMNLFLLSSGHGYGVVVDKSKKETFMAMGSLGGGLGVGAKDLSVVFIFKNADVMKKFIESGWQFGGEADATAKAGEKGVALQATVAGTKYWKDKKLNE
jgi:lipid-binding SYLF domain-containing protein